MKVLMINVVCGIRSTGRICTDLATALENQGHEVKIAYGREVVPEQYQKYAIRIGSDRDVKLHATWSRMYDACGWGSISATKIFIDWIKEFDPDIIHLHNIHGYYINVEILFSFLKTCGKRIIWTLHDCWAFTGHCCYFSAVECEKWREQCRNCVQIHSYPKSLIDRSRMNYLKKKKLFQTVGKMYLVTPSEWLSELVKDSFLREYAVRVIPNGIDTEIFCPTNSYFKKTNKIDDKKMLLGVASVWEKRKGFDDFLELRRLLPDEFIIVLVGLTHQQINELPKGIVGIEHTESIKELVDIYSAADIFINLSVEETMGLTTVEAMSCGTPSIVYNCTALPEVVDEISGIVVSPHDLEGVVGAIYELMEKRRDKLDPRAKAMNYRKQNRYEEYLMFYDEVMRA